MQPGDLLVEVLGEHVDALASYSVAAGSKSSIWAIAWLVKEFDITKLG